jgi:hypothetical protein
MLHVVVDELLSPFPHPPGMVLVVVVGHGLAWENGRKSAVLSSFSVCKSARLFSMCVGSARL